ncbi:MAG: hypothetical protein ACOYK0_06725 [Candidatus Nanopelagicaceae bacterium]
MRYFTKAIIDGKAYGLYRFEVQADRIVEEYWTTNGWAWDKEARIVGYLSICEPDLEEINEDVARKYFPQAFELSDSTTQQTALSQKAIDGQRADADLQSGEDLTEYRVLVTGSSIFAIMSGKQDYDKVLQFLNEKSAKGKLECFKWWCEECKKEPLNDASGPENHVLKISFPNVLKLIQGGQIDWNWKDPDSEWAINHGTAEEEFQDLVDRKSRPKWVILIARYVGG